MSAIFAQL